MFCYDYCIINFHVLCQIKYLNLNLNLISHGEKAFIIQMGSKEERISINLIKPVHCEMDRVQLAYPPRRGRPPIVPERQSTETIE